MSTDPLLRSADERQQRIRALTGGESGRVDLDALVRARSLDGSGRGAAPLNKRFALATVQQVVQANRREQVAALWASHDVVAAASAPDAADGDGASWRDARQAAAERQRLRQDHLAAAREEEAQLQQLEDAAARHRHLQQGGGASDSPGPLLPAAKRGRGGVGAEALSDSDEGSGGSAKRRRKEAKKKKAKKAKKDKERRGSRKHSRSP